MTVKYSKDHEWIFVDGDVGTVGISNHAQEELGDIVFVELPQIGDVLTQGDEACVIESVKAASEVFAPCSGRVVEINEVLDSNPEIVNQSAEEESWFFRVKISDFDGFLN